MNNAEFWKDELLKIGNVYNDCNFAIVKNKPVPCDGTSCSECECYNGKSCFGFRVQWMCAEHVEQPKLTKKERMFCELVEAGWIARDSGGFVYFHTEKPKKESNDIWFGDDYTDLNVLPVSFSFIKWEDEEPWSVEELLKLEVE